MQKNKVKSIVTIGPASDANSTLKLLMQRGVDVFRLNSSHGGFDYHRRVIKNIRLLNASLKKEVVILLDLPGPKLRIGQIKGGKLNLRAGQEYTLGPDADIELDNSILGEISIGDKLKLSDGKFEFKINGNNGSNIRAKSLNSGVLLPNQSINSGHLRYEHTYPTARDRAIIKFGLTNGINCFGLSFVSNAADVNNARKLVGKDSVLVSKIERPDALKNIKDILRATDIVMVARGDLGLNIDIAKLPFVQRSLIADANQAHKPVITATQMLESMTNSPIPTRAEVNDVFTAIYEGTDAVMLSEETSIGHYPLRAFQMLKKLIDSFDVRIMPKPEYGIKDEEDALADAAMDLAERAGVKDILIITSTGNSAFRLSRYHSNKRIFAMTDSKAAFLRLSFGRYIYPMLFSNLDKCKDIAISQIKKATGAKKIIVVSDGSVATHKARAVSLLYL